jgi:hypothetical protein
LASTVFTLRADGTVLRDGVPLQSRYVVVDNRVQVRGTRIAVLTPADVGEKTVTNHEALVLWRTNDRYVDLTRR